MFKKILTIFAIVFIIAITSFCTKSGRDTVKKRGELIVAMDIDVPGYYTIGGERYGYQYEIMQQYAQKLGVKLNVNPDKTVPYYTLFKKHKADIAALPRQNLRDEDTVNAVSIYKTSFVVLTKSKRPVADVDLDHLMKLFSKGKVLMSHAFTVTDTYDYLLENCDSITFEVSNEDSFDMIHRLSNNEYDYMICERSEAQLGCALVRNVRTLHQFEESLEMLMVINPHMNALLTDFQVWFAEFQQSDEPARLDHLYFSRGIVSHVINRPMINAHEGSISVYDTIIQRLSDEYDYDWRMIAAIAYHESKFNEFTISRQGAKGLMQIMPLVANQFGVEPDEILDPEVNITTGIRLLNKLQKDLKFKKKASFEDRMSIILACYNAGWGHVTDARRLAEKHGLDSDKWSYVSSYLLNKNDYLDDPSVRCGKFRGVSTLSYVKSVMRTYKAYCKVAPMATDDRLASNSK